MDQGGLLAEDGIALEVKWFSADCGHCRLLKYNFPEEMENVLSVEAEHWSIDTWYQPWV